MPTPTLLGVTSAMPSPTLSGVTPPTLPGVTPPTLPGVTPPALPGVTSDGRFIFLANPTRLGCEPWAQAAWHALRRGKKNQYDAWYRACIDAP
jgi:hypothetical protein